MKFDIEKNKSLIIIAILLLFIIFVILKFIFGVFSDNTDKTEKNSANISNTTDTTTQDKAKEDAKLKKLKKATEQERIRTYLGEYFKLLENKDYESAYKLLYADFKQSYFPTLDKYKEYIEKCNYPKMLAIKYNELKTYGYYYVVDLDITNMDPDASNSDSVVKENTKFVVKENDYDEFYLSFQL